MEAVKEIELSEEARKRAREMIAKADEAVARARTRRRLTTNEFLDRVRARQAAKRS